jgi:predicted TIM-barrel fold metal-dependent hydrolase
VDHDAWLAQVTEEVIDPDREIVDPHHHLFSGGRLGDYLVPQLLSDTGSGHRVTRTVHVECGNAYRSDGPSHLRPVGETEFVARAAADTRGLGGARIAGLVAHADLRLPVEQLDEVLDAHEAAGGGLFKGVRHSGCSALHPETLSIPGRAPAGLYLDGDFQRGVRRLGERGLTYDTWHHHHQNREFLELARAAPGTTVVLDHLGTPVGVGPFAGRHDEIFETWRIDITDISACPNVVAKLGGLAMPDNGFGWDTADRPPTSDEFVAAQRRWYHHMLDCFGPDRCMFESNFPVDRRSLSYLVLWNGLKKIAARYSGAEQDALFVGTASRVYRLD